MILDRWHSEGVLRLSRLIADVPIDAYCRQFAVDAKKRSAASGDEPAEIANGYGIGAPHLTHQPMLDLCLDRRLIGQIEAILGAPARLHHTLTGWSPLFREWHQDRYLDPEVGVVNVGAWIALADVVPDAGPFEYVAGSHRLGSTEQAALLESLAGGADVRTERFLARKGDVLLWNPDLVHRGSVPPSSLWRPALIAHYGRSPLHRRQPSAETGA